MLRVLPVLILGIMPTAAVWAGPIAAQFGSGCGRVPWGMSLTELVGMMPAGDHYFSAVPGNHVYIVKNDDPLLGVPRTGMTVQYVTGRNDGVATIGLGVPYERREQLLAALIAQFGQPAVTNDTSSIFYRWTQDQNIRIWVRASRDPRYGIVEFWIDHSAASPENAHAGGAS
jgi:hypothetical protein